MRLFGVVYNNVSFPCVSFFFRMWIVMTFCLLQKFLLALLVFLFSANEERFF